MKKLLSTIMALSMLITIIGIMPVSADSTKYKNIDLAITGTDSNGLPVGETIKSPNAAFSVKCLDSNGYKWEVIFSQYVTYWQDSSGAKITTGKIVEANTYYTLNIGVHPIDNDLGEDDIDINQVKSITFNGVKLSTSQYRRGELGTSIYITAKFWYANVTGATGAGYYFPGETVAVKANNAPSGQHFKNWKGAYGPGAKYLFAVDFNNASASSTTFKMPATSHNYINPIYEDHTPTTIKGTAATCTTTGKTDGTKCSVCGKILTAQKTIPKKGHSYTDTVVKPTCTEKGYTLHKCSVCGDNYKNNYTDALGHSNKNITKKSTYFEKGYTAKQCTRCGAISNKKETSILQMAAPKATVSAYSIKLTWSKVSGAQGYEVWQLKSGKWTKIKTITSTSYTVSKLPSGTSQKFAIKPYKKSGSKTVYGCFSKQLYTTTNPATVNFNLTAGSRKATVKWNKVTGASGYKIYYKTSKNGSWKLLKTVNNKTTSFTKTGLSSGNTYYFTVRAYRTLNGTTYNGAFATKSIKVK
ncbi:MAG: fibronectin type III domain-containing protein [Oscillospiraceae bacterium]